jgi:hypothetical protein
MASNLDNLFILALGLSKKAGVTEARVDYPLKALNELPGVTAHFDSGSVKIPNSFKEAPGLFILHRQIMNDAKMKSKVEELIDHGWVVVSDIDDDPHHWRGFIESNFFAFRAVHAVTVSTEPLADMVRLWNPNVTVLRNEIFELPNTGKLPSPKNPQFSIFFGALNRIEDWKTIEREMVLLAHRYPNVHWKIVHDRDVFESLPSSCMKTYFSTLTHSDYMEVLASCDVSLLPLNNTKFNNHKSDLKLIESLACQTVPICSRVVYGENPRHTEVACFPLTPKDWHDHLEYFIENPQSLLNLRLKGLDYVKNERMHKIQAPIRASFYRELVRQREDLEIQRQERVRRMGIAGT